MLFHCFTLQRYEFYFYKMDKLNQQHDVWCR